MDNVNDNHKNCSGCGLCESICPANAIEIKESNGFNYPYVDPKCTKCGLCLKYCPNTLKSSYSYKDYKKAIWGHSCDEALRKQAASGGIVTELLSYLIRDHYVDYVITADHYFYDRNCGTKTIDDADDISEYAGSNYCPVSIGREIRKIKERDGTCAIVCLPCLARGISKAIETDKELKNKIKYVFTLLCNHVPSYNATKYLIKKYKVKKPSLVKYRGNGWFGNLRFYTGSRETAYFEYFSTAYSEYFSTAFSECFWSNACINCTDHFGKYADASFGDADFVKYRDINKQNDGETICFINNLQVDNILNKMYSERKIELSFDYTEKELDEIYGPLLNENVRTSANTRQSYTKIRMLENYSRCRNWLCMLLGTIKKQLKY